MFKDTDQELARLEAELLKVEEPDTDYAEDLEEEYEEDYEDQYEEAEEELPEYYYQDTRAADGPGVYQNYSNDYGRNLRNFASGYQAYNTDDCDEDLDEYSDDVQSGAPERGNNVLLALACALTLAGAAALLLLLRLRGLI